MSVMESARLRYIPDQGGGGAEEDESSSHVQLELPCFLDIYVHHARNIHNICIYANQDVYAKFALTSSPDHAPALSTRIAAGGGASPRFEERVPPLRVRRGNLGVDVLKCEVWMRSCAKNLLEDQLLGFALVPLAAVAAADGARLAQDFELSSTDLLHSPAGTIRLSLALYSGLPGDACPPPERSAERSIASEVIILEPAPPVDYSRIEFDDLNVEKENDTMAVQYLPFLHLEEARPPEAIEDCEMSTSPRMEKPASSDGSKNASTTTTVSDDRVVSSSAEATEKPRPDADESTAPMSCRSPDTPTSCSKKTGKAKATDVFKSPLGDIDMDAEQSAMQRQIMEMYVKSMQQFSESLAKMKLPMELGVDNGVVVHKEEKPNSEVKRKRKQQQEVKKDGARVFYGSRAFF
uniref:C2 domain-containing protein n=1 Tax=Arundo donax TaxID=35708 RepID=A0A0A9DNH3_ARUDO